MLFFKRILGKSEMERPPERRGNARYAVGATFPLKAAMNAIGRDEIGQLLKSKDGKGWDWEAHILNVSVSGVRIQVPPTMHSHKGDPCVLKLEIENYPLAVPGKLVHVQERRDSFVYGLELEVQDDSKVARAYRQLVELIALGAALKSTKKSAPDKSGYLVEQYGGDEVTTLDVWRDVASREIRAFDFRLRDCRVRGVVGQGGPQFLLNVEGDTPRVPPPAMAAEMKRLFQWVVPNVSEAVPEDVRAVLINSALLSAAE